MIAKLKSIPRRLVIFLLNYWQRKSAQDIARNKQHQTTLETYFDRMTELILEKGLGTKKAKKGVQSIARTRTLIVLRNLDTERVGEVFQFIQDADLEDAISLAMGNLRGVNWSGANLMGADLSGANLGEANLGGTYLVNANLSGTFLFRVNLMGAFLENANLSGTYLDGADLRETKLMGANLLGAEYYSDEQLRAATSLKESIGTEPATRG